MRQELAVGGQGRVFLAQHTELAFDAERVVKIIRPEVLKVPGMAKRFTREVQLTAALSQKNDHIVRIYDDFGLEEGLGHYYVMEFLDGEPLSDLLKRHPRLPLGMALRLFHQISKGLLTAHEREVVHRDLKPDNIFLVSLPEGEIFAKLIDFGIAKSNDNTPLTQGVIGTPLYMAPEQCRAGIIDNRTDIYSLGVMLYELITGRHPYGFDAAESLTPMQILSAHLMQAPNPLTYWLPEEQALSDILARTMAKKPEQRQASLVVLWDEICQAYPAMSLPSLRGSVQLYRPELLEELPALQEMAYDTTGNMIGPHTPPTGEEVFRLEEDEEDGEAFEAVGASQWPLVLGVLCCLLFGGGGLFFLWPTANNKAKHTEQHTDAAPKKPSQGTLPADRGTTPARRVEPVGRVAPERTRPDAPPIMKPRKRPYPRKRNRRVTRRRPIKRRPKRTIYGPCGAPAKGKRWVVATLQKPARGRPRVSVFGCASCRLVRRRGKLCLSLPSGRPAKVEVSVSGYEDCSHQILPTDKTIGWVLRIPDPDALADATYNCVRR